MTADRIMLFMLFGILAVLVYSCAFGSATPELEAISHIIDRPGTPHEEIPLKISELAQETITKRNIPLVDLIHTIDNGLRYDTLQPKYKLCFSPNRKIAFLYDDSRHYIKVIHPGANLTWIDMWLQSRDKYKVKK